MKLNHIKIHVSKLLILVSIVYLFQSCSKNKEVYDQIYLDIETINNSSIELIDFYDTCIEMFSEQSMVADGRKRIFCTINTNHLDSLRAKELNSTINLIEKGYKIKLDAKERHRIFFECKKDEYFAGVIRYGLLFSQIDKTIPNVYSINLSDIDTLKTIDENNFIIKIDSYFE